MPLAAQCMRSFDSRIRHRGHQYYTAGRVEIRKSAADFVEARVRGTSRYDVRLRVEAGGLETYCACPYFAGHGACKHIWATLLKAEDEGVLQLPEKTPPVEPPSRLYVPRQTVAGLGEAGPRWASAATNAPHPIPDDSANHGLRDVVSRLRASVAVPQYAFRHAPQPTRPKSWKHIIEGVSPHLRYPEEYATAPELRPQSIRFVVDARETVVGGKMLVHVEAQIRKQNGELGRPRPLRVTAPQIDRLPDPADRQIVALLAGSLGGAYSYRYEPAFYGDGKLSPESLRDLVLPMMLRTGRCWLSATPGDEPLPLALDDGPAWEFHMAVEAEGEHKPYMLRGRLCRGDQSEDLATPVFLVKGGWVFWRDRAARLQDFGAFRWIALLRRERQIMVPRQDGEALLEHIFQHRCLPPIDWPAELRVKEIAVPPQPHLTIHRRQYDWDGAPLTARLTFDYAGVRVVPHHDERMLILTPDRQLVRRDPEREAQARARLHELGVRDSRQPAAADYPLELSSRHLPRVVGELLKEQWQVEAQGKAYRRAGTFSISVTSGVDWFELRGSLDFGGVRAELPALLQAMKKGENLVALTDGTLGMLPEDWLTQFGPLAGLGAAGEDHIRFQKCQAGLLDVLLAAQPEAACDAVFERVRTELRSFESIRAADPEPGFHGILRPYQREGLGWLHFLRQFGFGGCLADDMGLGKTVQVLALLESRRARRQERLDGPEAPVPPSLVVVPRSLIFNWRQEAGRFAPGLRVLDHTGIQRSRDLSAFNAFDLVLTTYGTVRRDIALLKDVLFDYVILDEAQAIKNASASTTKATRLLKARHKLAMSGTPVQNHLGELWSLFEFLNPGMLGTTAVFKLTEQDGRNPDPATRVLLSRALRPFILRRTKSQVARDLPERVEETIYCEMDKPQRKLYDELRDHYRQSLLQRIERDGINRSKMHILEALLRLRQAACHPGLVDKGRTAEPSAKLEMLLPQLAEVIEEDHKVLVFSQFTSMLAIVRSRLDAQGIVYEYLDGRTRDREARVQRFQSDPECKLFLISLKAGGLGLNLTAAEYVFLLDPWWNPSVEAQAIDRAHRIGQSRKVFAYRLITMNTVEEKVLELQQSKRDLADAIINADNSLIRTLGREDLELLLG